MTGVLPIMPKVLELDAEAWALRISARWRASTDAIIEVGQLLIDAKGRLPHGEFGAMLETALPFSTSTAQRLMAIAADKRLSNPAHVQYLPPYWGTLYEITKLSDHEFDHGIENGIIRPDMERKAIELIRLAPQRSPRGIESSDGAGESRPRLETDVGPGEIRSSSRSVNAEAGTAPGPSEATPLPNGARAIMGSRQEPSDSLDFFPTPPWATRALIEHVFPQIGRRSDSCWNKTAWEPACGEGHMAETLREYFELVFASDIHNYGYSAHGIDFLGGQPDIRPPFDWIITNPPFGDLGEAFTLKALDLAGTGVAMFMRVQWLDTIGRYERIFRDHAPTLIAFFAERVPLCKGHWDPKGSTATAYMWLVWLKGEKPRAPFWIPPGCREALTRPDDVERFTQRPVSKRQATEIGNREAAE